MNETDFSRIMNQKLDMLHSMFNRYQLTVPARAHYVSALMDLRDNKIIWQAIDELATGTHFPYIQDVRDKVKEISRRGINAERDTQQKFLPPVKENLKTTNLHAVLSIMWMHYEYGHPVHSMGTVVDLYHLMFPGEKFDFERLRNEFPKEKVYAWMNTKSTNNSEKKDYIRAA